METIRFCTVSEAGAAGVRNVPYVPIVPTTWQVKVALQTGDFVLQKARAMMPAVDLEPNTPASASLK